MKIIDSIARKKIPVNVISGFLGSGKTTVIFELLKHAPKQERWAVLVNEFGEIGIDGAILETSGAVIKEVAGGCICCVNNLPLQISLNMLIATAKPDRLLIEPTGLAHPGNLLDMLNGDGYSGLFDVRAMITLIDARHSRSVRHRDNDLFIDQLNAADVIVASKNDVADDNDRTDCAEFLAQLDTPRTIDTFIEQGRLDLAWLDLPCHWQGGRRHPQHVLASANTFGVMQKPQAPLPLVLPEGQAFLRKENRGGDAFSCGWLFAKNRIFRMNHLVALLHSMQPERAKAVMRTDQGNFIFNMQDEVLSVHDALELEQSRLEIIHHELFDWDVVESHLLALSESMAA